MDAAERLQLIPLTIDENGALFITMADPLNLRAQDEIRRLTGYDLHIAVSGTDDVKRNLQRIYNVPYITVSGIKSERVTENKAAAATEENVLDRRQKLGEVLLKYNAITKAQLEEAFRVQRDSGKSFIEVLEQIIKPT